jgi:hypothetical protein
MSNNGKSKKPRVNPKNPLNGFKTRDLLITFIMLLLIFAFGFGVGFSCSRSDCKSASADVLSSSDIHRVPVRPMNGSDSSGIYQYVFNMYLGNDLYTANFAIREYYDSSFLLQSHWLALAYNNDFTPYEYVINQLYEYTSEDGFFGLQIMPSAVDVEYELYYTFYSDEEPNRYYYDFETL